MSDILVFIACMIDGLILIVLSVYLIILLSDLECDFLNTKQGCKRLNQWVLPETIASAFIPVLLLLTWHWFLFLLTCPLPGYLIHRYVTLPAGSIGVYDPTEIRNRGTLGRFQKETFIKIGVHLITFFISLYGFIMALIDQWAELRVAKGNSLRANVARFCKNNGRQRKAAMMATDHAASVFTHSLLSTPRDPITRLPADRLSQSTGRPRSQETGGTSHKLTPSSVAPSRPSTCGGMKSSKWTGAEESRDDTFQASLGPDTPYIRSVTIRSGKTRQATDTSQFSSPEINSRKREHLDPSTVVGNERRQPPSSTTARNDDYATLFATLLESNMLLREEIQKLRADNQKTMTAVERLQGQTHNEPVLLKNDHQPDSSAALDSDESALSLDSDEQGLPPNLLQNTWMESSTDQGENQRPSCLASSQSLPGSADDQHEYDLVDRGHKDLNSEGESSVEVDPLEIDSESVGTCSSDSSRPSSPSAVHEEVCAHSSRSTESLLSSSSSSSSLTSSASSSERMQARRANEGDPFASPGMQAIERMWSDFSIEDYAPRGSYGNEQEKEGKCRDRKKEWTPKITVPKPFLMTVRESQSPKRKSRSMIQAEQERLEREALEEAELRKQFRATPLPASTYLPLYELINAKNEQRREEMKMLSKQILSDSERPFSFTKRDNERRLMRKEEMRRSLELEKIKLKEATFSAKPVPKHLFDPDVAERLKEQEDYREIRIRLRAQELLAKSKLPGNMQLKGREYSLGALRKKRLEENQDKAFMTDEHIFHPAVSSGVPDYDQAYLEFQKQLALKKRTKHTTATEPFYLRTQLIPSRKEQVLQDIQREEELRSRNRWPLTAPSAKASSRSPKHARTKSSGVPYPSQLTKTAKVRFSLSQDKMAHALAKERALKNEERERRERQEALKMTVSQKSQSCDPTPWLEERKEKKYHQLKQLDKERQRKYERELEEMKQRVENRPLLFERVPGASSATSYSPQATTRTKARLTEENLNHEHIT